MIFFTHLKLCSATATHNLGKNVLYLHSVNHTYYAELANVMLQIFLFHGQIKKAIALQGLTPEALTVRAL